MVLKTQESLALLDLVALILATAETHAVMELPQSVQGCLEQLAEVLQPIQDQHRASGGDTQ